MTLGEKIKEARKQCGLSQEQLAEKMAVSRSAVATWEANNGLPDVDNLKALAQLLNVSVDYLLDDGEVIDEDIMRVAKVCGIDKFIRSLPQGLDTVLTEGTTISAGQKQLLTIARAMLQDAPMLILDEATSSVDTRTEVIIQRAMDELTKGRTSFVIAHRLSTIRNADLILVMKDGDVIKSGDHEELMQKGGFYYQLYQSQFDVEEQDA